MRLEREIECECEREEELANGNQQADCTLTFYVHIQLNRIIISDKFPTNFTASKPKVNSFQIDFFIARTILLSLFHVSSLSIELSRQKCDLLQ